MVECLVIALSWWPRLAYNYSIRNHCTIRNRFLLMRARLPLTRKLPHHKSRRQGLLVDFENSINRTRLLLVALIDKKSSKNIAFRHRLRQRPLDSWQIIWLLHSATHILRWEWRCIPSLGTVTGVAISVRPNVLMFSRLPCHSLRARTIPSCLVFSAAAVCSNVLAL
jgi:hypothetical protein